MVVVVEFGNVLMYSAEDGKPTLANSRNVDGVGKPSIAGRNVSTALSEGHRFWSNVLIYSAEDGKPTLANSRNVDGVGKPSIAGRNARVQRGVKVTGFGAVRKTRMKMLLRSNNTTARVVMVAIQISGNFGEVVTVPVGRRERRGREQPTRDRGHHGQQGDSDTSTVRGYRASGSGLLVTAPPSTTANTRAEGSITRDRTLQQQHPSRMRPRQNPDSTNAAYLTFQVQGQDSNGRRRAETITRVSAVVSMSNRPPAADVHRPALDVHRPAGDVHRPPVSDVHRPASDVHRPAPSDVHRRPGSDVRRIPGLDVHRPGFDVHRPAADVHRPAADVHRSASDVQIAPTAPAPPRVMPVRHPLHQGP